MAKFIKVHIEDIPTLANVDHIQVVRGCPGMTLIKMRGCGFECRESYEEILKMIAVATGGITLPPMKGD